MEIYLLLPATLPSCKYGNINGRLIRNKTVKETKNKKITFLLNREWLIRKLKRIIKNTTTKIKKVRWRLVNDWRIRNSVKNAKFFVLGFSLNILSKKSKTKGKYWVLTTWRREKWIALKGAKAKINPAKKLANLFLVSRYTKR